MYSMMVEVAGVEFLSYEICNYIPKEDSLKKL